MIKFLWPNSQDMAFGLVMWFCSLPLVALLVGSLFGIKVAVYVALILLLILMAICWGLCGWKIFKR
jgi:hypothetical protein